MPRRTITNTQLLAAYGTVPGWTELNTTHAKLRDIKAQQFNELDHAGPINVAALSDQLIDGVGNGDGTDLDGLAREYEETKTEQSIIANRLAIASEAVLTVEQRLGDLERRGRTHIHEALQQIHDDVITQIQATVQDGAPRSAEQAIRTGQTEIWTELATLQKDYNNVVLAYLEFARDDSNPQNRDRTARVAGLVFDPLSTHPMFQQRRSDIVGNRYGDTIKGTDSYQAWAAKASTPTHGTGKAQRGITPEGADPLTWLIHIATTNAAYLRHPDEIDEVYNLAITATRSQISTPELAAAVRARNVYTEKLGTDEDIAVIPRPAPKQERIMILTYGDPRRAQLRASWEARNKREGLTIRPS